MLSVSVGLTNFSVFFVVLFINGCLMSSVIPNLKYGSTIRHYFIKSFTVSETGGTSGNEIR